MSTLNKSSKMFQKTRESHYYFKTPFYQAHIYINTKFYEPKYKLFVIYLLIYTNINENIFLKSC